MVAAWILPIHLAFNHGSTGTGPVVAGRFTEYLREIDRIRPKQGFFSGIRL